MRRGSWMVSARRADGGSNVLDEERVAQSERNTEMVEWLRKRTHGCVATMWWRMHLRFSLKN